MNWISIKDALPCSYNETCNFSKDVLVTSPTLGVDIGAYYVSSGKWFFQGKEWGDVTHWQPLPAPPKENNDDTQ